MPSHPVLSRFSFDLDCAYMRATRDRLVGFLEGDVLPSVHLMVDSSPQGGIDWSNSSYILVSGQDLAEFHGCYCALVAAARRLEVRWVAQSVR